MPPPPLPVCVPLHILDCIADTNTASARKVVKPRMQTPTPFRHFRPLDPTLVESLDRHTQASRTSLWCGRR